VNSLFDAIFDTPRTSGYVLLDRHSEIVAELSYEQLVLDGARRAAELSTMLERVRPGSVVVLVFNDPLQFVTALFACVYLGVAALPVAPRQVRHVARRLKTAGASLIVAEAALVPGLLAASRPGGSETPLGMTGALEGVPVHGWSECEARGAIASRLGSVSPAPQSEHETALMQLSSGTTGEPSIVQLSARNICSNERIIARHFGHIPASRVLGWLPHTHDMGLFGTLLQPFFVDCVGYLARPNDFVREPLSWLRSISRYSVTTSGAPTFAYASACASADTSCAFDPGAVDALDLSSWDVAFVGAEPVRTTVLQAFCDRFAAAGFNPKALMPCYGLAEAALFVTGERRGAGVQVIREANGLVDGITLVTPDLVCVGSVGEPGTTQVRLRTVGSLRATHPGDRVGEILIAGPSVTRAPGVARIDPDWIATGDLGLLRGTRLYLCARLKEVIKVRGQSVCLAEVDQCVGTALQDSSIHVCSFEIPEPRGSNVVWVALQSKQAFVNCDVGQCRQIKANVLAQLGVSIRLRVLPPRPRCIMRTASGKLNRGATRNACLSLEPVPVG
jgi:acyl-CoA synthetase (AMP-forming)/AMP-acid ligase II